MARLMRSAIMRPRTFISRWLPKPQQVSTISHLTLDIAASQVGAFNPGDVFANAKTTKSQDRFTHLAAAAARMAVDDAKLDLGAVDKTLFGCYVGSAFGGMATFEEQTLKLAKSGPPKVSPFTIPALLGNTASSVIGIELGSQGPNFGVTSACAVGSHAIGNHFYKVRQK